jgi:hypothetical protein
MIIPYTFTCLVFSKAYRIITTVYVIHEIVYTFVYIVNSMELRPS